MGLRHARLAILAGTLGSGCNIILGGGDYKVGHGASGGTAGTSSSSLATSTSTTMSSSANSGSSTSSSQQAIMVSPASATLLASTTLTFTATINGVTSSDVTWTSLDPAGMVAGGTVTPAGVYTAGTTSGSFVVRATSKVDGSHSDAQIQIVTSATPVPIVATGAVNAPTGFGSQSHLAYAAGPGEWWLFYDVPGVAQVGTRHSKDFATWTDGTSTNLPQAHSNDGRDLSVASKRVQGRDIVHVSVGATMFGRYHLNAVATDGQLAFDPPRLINSGGDTAPDGSGIVILDDGTVIDTTGWQATPQTPPLSPCGNGDVDMFISQAKDDGSVPFTTVGFQEQVVWCVGDHVTAHKLIGIGQVMYALYVDGESNAAPVNILVSTRLANGTWMPVEAGTTKVKPPTAFPIDEAMGLDDWTATASGSTVHAVRRVAGGFEYQTLAPGGWTAGPAILPALTALGSGLVLVPYGDGMVLLALTTDGTILYAAYNGTTWSNWRTLVAASTAARTFLSGYAPGGSAKPAIIWTENGQIMGAKLP